MKKLLTLTLLLSSACSLVQASYGMPNMQRTMQNALTPVTDKKRDVLIKQITKKIDASIKQLQNITDTEIIIGTIQQSVNQFTSNSRFMTYEQVQDAIMGMYPQIEMLIAFLKFMGQESPKVTRALEIMQYLNNDIYRTVNPPVLGGSAPMGMARQQGMKRRN